MPEPGVISEYLDELASVLHVPPRHRKRAIAESREHLLDAARNYIDHGVPPPEAEAAAIERFGSVPVVSAAYHRQSASTAARASLLAVVAAAVPAIVAQVIGSPLFWRFSGRGLRPAGPWPIDVKDGLVLAADLRAVADVVALLSLVVGVAVLLGKRSLLGKRGGRAASPWPSTLVGLGAAAALGCGALAGLAELTLANSVGPRGARLAVAVGLLMLTAVGAAGAQAWLAWRLWRVRSGWVPADGLIADARDRWSRLSPRARGALRRGLVLAIPGVIAVTFAAGLVEAVQQGNLRSGANNPQQAIAAGAARRLASGVDPAAVADGSKVDLARSLDVHITVFDSAGRVLASTAVLDGRTPVPPAGVLRTASRHTDVLTWQPQPAVRVAAVATAWSGPASRGTLVVGRSLKIVEQRESRLLRRIVRWWLLWMALIALAALAAAWWQPPPRAVRKAQHHSAGVAPA